MSVKHACILYALHDVNRGADTKEGGEEMMIAA